MAMRISASGAQHQKDESKNVFGFGKAWEPGTNLRTFYPCYFDEETNNWELLVGAVWGHKVNDMKEISLKTTFIPTTTPIEYGVPVGVPDITYQFSRVAKLIVEGMKQAELTAVAKKRWPTKSEEAKAIQKVTEKYDTQKSKDAPKAVIGKLTYLITTECYCIAITGDNNDKLDFDKSMVASQELSSARIKQLGIMLKDPEVAPTKEFPYLEVAYPFPVSTSKSESGRTVAPTGVSHDKSLLVKFPAEKEKLLANISGIATDSDMIMHRNYSYRAVPAETVRQAIKSYAVMKSEYLDCLEDEDQIIQLAKSYKLLETLNLMPNIHNDALLKAIDEQIAKDSTAVTEDHFDADDAKNIENASGAPTINKLTQNAANVTDEVANDAQASGVEVEM